MTQKINLVILRVATHWFLSNFVTFINVSFLENISLNFRIWNFKIFLLHNLRNLDNQFIEKLTAAVILFLPDCSNKIWLIGPLSTLVNNYTDTIASNTKWLEVSVVRGAVAVAMFDWLIVLGVGELRSTGLEVMSGIQLPWRGSGWRDLPDTCPYLVYNGCRVVLSRGISNRRAITTTNVTYLRSCNCTGL